jgi:hypothetical protein
MFITKYDHKERTWYDKNGKPYEWHPDDPMRLRDVIVWRMCQSNNRYIRRWGQKMWKV